MATVSERVHVMKQNFMALHEKGYSIPEIALEHNLSKITIYRHLQEIADKNSVSRESLLKVIRVQNNSERAWRKKTSIADRVGADLKKAVNCNEW